MPASHVQVLQQFRNCYLLLDHKIVKEDLWVRDGKILNPEKVFFDEQIQADVQIDCHGALIAPGYIDVQINGAFGVDFSQPVDEETLKKDVDKVANGLLSHGVTSFVPTLVTSPSKHYHKILPVLRRRDGTKDRAGVLGVHVEGPFINLEKKGAHHPDYISTFDKGVDDVERMYGSLDNISVITLAPELAGSGEVIRSLTQKGITVSVGHSMASLQEGEDAVKAGASFITHLFNAMLPFHHRDPHLVGLLASDQIPEGRTVYYGMIADGIHTHPAALRIAHRTNVKGIVLVTDAMSAMGLPPGSYQLGPMEVDVTETAAYVAGTKTLCGSVATMKDSVKYFFEKTECTKVEVLEAATLHPAESLNITHTKGTLNYNSDADFILLDNSLELLATFVGGHLAWENKEYHRTVMSQIPPLP